jgi:hypothetical protein
MHDILYFSVIVVRTRSGQEETIHLSEFKTVTVWFEGQHNDELYAYCLDLEKLMLIFNLCMIHFILVLLFYEFDLDSRSIPIRFMYLTLRL